MKHDQTQIDGSFSPSNQINILRWIFLGKYNFEAKLYVIIIIIIIAEMAVFNVAGYLIEERRRWPVITASPRGQYSK